jgi:rRNA-processing protein FCF1
MRTLDIGRPILLDANIILNAAFLRGGQCDRALTMLHASGKAFQIEETTWSECVNRLRKIIGNDAANRAVDHMTERLSHLRVLQVPPDQPIRLERRHDAHIITSAVSRNLIVLTADNELQARLLRRGVTVITPDGPEFWDHPLYGPPIAWFTEQQARYVREFLILVWTRPADWFGQITGSYHALFSADAWGCLSFDNTSQPAIRFDGSRGAALSAHLQPQHGYPLVTAVSTRHNSSNLQATRSAIYVSCGPSNRTSKSVPAPVVPLLQVGTPMWLGSDRGQSKFWSGYISAIKIVPAWLSSNMWKLIADMPDFRPSFCTDADKLVSAVRRFATTPAI